MKRTYDGKLIFREANCFSNIKNGSMEPGHEIYGTPNIAHTFSSEMTFKEWKTGYDGTDFEIQK